MSYFDNVCNKCGDNNEGCKCVSVTVPEQTAILDKLQLLQLQLDELKRNVEREVTRRVKNTLESNADLKLEVRNLRDELTDLRASNRAVTAEREHLKQQLTDEARKNERGLADAEKQVAFYRLAADKLDRLLEIILEYGADESDDIAGFIERLGSERNKLKGELVDVRSALAAASQERDSLRITLDAWQEADTKPIVKVEVADHVLLPVVPDGVMVSAFTASAEGGETCSCSAHPHPPCSHCQPLDVGEPDPANDEKDAKLEFRNVVPTPEMIAYVQWWDTPTGETSICFKHLTQNPVVWRRAGDNGDNRWQYEDCPQPLKPHGMTWQQLDKVLADKKAAELPDAPVSSAAVPLCMTCHECGFSLRQYGRILECSNHLCHRADTRALSSSPFYGPCKSSTPVRHHFV